MSFELFFQPVVNGHALNIGRSELRSLFPVIEEESKLDYWSIRYNSLNSCHIGVKAFDSSANQLASFYVERPCGEPEFWEALFQVLKRGQIVLYFPGGPPIVGNEQDAASLPKNAVAPLGEARCVSSGGGILEILKEF